MKANAEQRSNQRFYYEKPVMLEDERTGYNYDGTIRNYSESGMYIESDYAPRPSRKIRIKVNDLPNISTPRIYRAEVKWRRPLSQNPSPYSYGIGVRYC